MDLLLTEPQRLLQAAAARLCASAGGAKRARWLRDAGSELDGDAWAAVIKAGWLASMVEEGHGGLGLGVFDLALALEEAGKRLLMLPLAEAASAAFALSQAAARHPPSPALADLLSGACLIIPATQSCAWRFVGAAAETGLRFDPATSSLTGSAPGVGFAGEADLLLVDAVGPDQDLWLCLAPARASGVVLTSAGNVDGSRSNSVSFTAAQIRNEHVLARSSTAAALLARLHELLVLATAAELLGLAHSALHLTLEHLKLRQQFGRPIGSFQVLQHRMVDCFVELELNRSLLYRVLSAWDKATCHPAMVSAVKAKIARGALATVRAALQFHGAIGYTDAHDIGLHYKRAVALAAKFGNEINHVDRFSALTVL